MTEGPISQRQMRRLLILWRQYCSQSGLDAKDRMVRLDWTSGVIGRQIASYRELRGGEANIAMNALVKLLPPELYKGKRPSRRLAQAYGTAGRRGDEQAELQLVDAATLGLLNRLRAQLGWTLERLEGFLHSSKSPVRSGVIRTLAEANRAIWALKALLRQQGKHSASKRSGSGLGNDDAATETFQRAG